MDDQFQDLQRLLRLKRHEAPPPEYFEDFLFDFHRRQRAELLRRPLWRLALDRLEGAIPSLTPARYAYAGSCAAAVAVAALMSGHILTSRPVDLHGGFVASANAGSVSTVPVVSVSTKKMARYDLRGPRSSIRLPEPDFDQAQRQVVASSRNSVRPRYVLDTQPVSYEQSSSF